MAPLRSSSSSSSTPYKSTTQKKYKFIITAKPSLSYRKDRNKWQCSIFMATGNGKSKRDQFLSTDGDEEHARQEAHLRRIKIECEGGYEWEGCKNHLDYKEDVSPVALNIAEKEI